MVKIFESLIERLQESNCSTMANAKYYDAKCWFFKCYDYLFPLQEESKPISEMTNSERREWIYGK